MKIYKLTVNKVQDDPMGAIVSSYRAPRTEKSAEYFLNEIDAKKRQTDIYEGMLALAGFLPGIEAIITEIDVKE